MPPRATRSVPNHRLLRAARLLLSDLLSTFAFVALYAVTDNIAVAVPSRLILSDHGTDGTTAFGYVWAALMLLIAVRNLAFAAKGSHAAWGWFIAMAPVVGKAAMVLTQYAVTRATTHRRIRTAQAVALAAT